MADQKGPLGDPKQAASTIKSLAEETGNFNDAVKESVDLLKQTVKSYEKMESVLSTLSEKTLNIKKIEQELAKARSEDFRIQKKLSDLEKNMGSDFQNRLQKVTTYTEKLLEQENNAKKIKDLSATIRDMEQAGIDASQERITVQDLFNSQRQIALDLQQNSLNSQELELSAMLAANKQAHEKVKLAEDFLDKEKQVQEKLGKTGALVAFLSKNLGVGKDLYAKMVEEARKDEGVTKLKVIGMASLLALGKALYNTLKSTVSAIGDGMNSLTGTGGPISKATSQFTNLIKQIPLVGGLLGGIAEIGVNMLDMVIGAGSETQKFARNLGISYEQAKKISDEFVRMSIYSGQSYLTLEKIRQSQTELSQALGLNNILSKEILESDAKLREQGALDLETRKDLVVVAKLQNATQTQIYANIMGQTAAMNRLTGLNFRVQDSVKELSKLSGILGLTFAKYPKSMMETFTVVKSLGLDLQRVNDIASGLLDFENSISKEFEAQLITGENINLNKAREFALTNNIAGLAVELTNQFKSSENYLNKNRLAQETWAASVGMTRDEVADMLKKQELYAKVGAQSEEQFKRTVQMMRERGTLQSEFVDKLSEEQAQLFLNSTTTETIANFFDKIKQSFANMLNTPAVKKFIDEFMVTLNDPNFVENLVNKLTNFAQVLANIAGTLVQAVGYVVQAADVLTFGAIPEEIEENLKKIGQGISSISIGSAVVKSSAGSSSGYPYAGDSANSGGTPGTMNINFNATLDDNERKNSIRMKMAAQNGYNTGPYGR